MKSFAVTLNFFLNIFGRDLYLEDVLFPIRKENRKPNADPFTDRKPPENDLFGWNHFIFLQTLHQMLYREDP